jgi:Cu-processing system permease protein
MNRMIRFVALDILKNRTILFYTILLAVLSWSVFSLEDNSTKGILTLLNLILLTVPLVSIIFSTIYIYNASEFIDLLVSQPISRTRIWISLFIGVTCSQLLAFIIGAGIPILLFAPFTIALFMIVGGCLITIAFIAIGFLASVSMRDKSKGIGIAIMLWLYFALLFDGIVLFLLFQLSDYPIEQGMIAVTLLSPIDLTRIMILLQMDVSALLGYTGAVFKEFFGSTFGIMISAITLFLWGIIPFYVSLLKFNKRDL